MAIMNFERLTICSNTILGGGQLLTIDGVTIVNGITHPVVTIISSTNLGSPNPTWNTYVFQNRENHPAVRVEIGNNNRVSVYASGKTVLDARMDAQNSCIVGALDLRPLGLIIYGDANSLMAFIFVNAYKAI